MGKLLPDFDKLVPLYPGKGYTAQSIKNEIGGDVNKPDIDDTCIVRISKPLNYLGHAIPPWSEQFRTRKGKDGFFYGLRVKEFWPYLERVYGPPTKRSTRPIEAKKFKGLRGIIGFRVNKWAARGSTGHFTLWDGFNLLYGGEDHDYFAIADEVGLWEAGNIRTSSPDV
jgi:hypothetical protein